MLTLLSKLCRINAALGPVCVCVVCCVLYQMKKLKIRFVYLEYDWGQGKLWFWNYSLKVLIYWYADNILSNEVEGMRKDKLVLTGWWYELKKEGKEESSLNMYSLGNYPLLTRRHNVRNSLSTGPCLTGMGGHLQCLSYMSNKWKKSQIHRCAELKLEDMEILFDSFVLQVIRRCRPRKS